ncbi:MAG TPA: VOC family protein [Myxococcales bacterium]|nr:VOC family protein [Myxococcales bacterium]
MRAALLLALLACSKSPALFEHGLDHVGIAVTDLAAARKTFHDGLGFGAVVPGKLPNGIENINYYFEDSTYLETLTAYDPQKARQVADFTAKGEGAIFAALSINSPDAAKAFFDKRGVKTGAPIPGSIKTERESTSWKTMFFEGSAKSLELFFFIAYDQPQRNEMLSKLHAAIQSGKVYKHPNGALGIKAAWLAVPDLEQAVKQFEAAGFPAGATFAEPRLGGTGRLIEAGQGKIALIAPAASDSPVAQLLARRGGPALLGLSIEVSLLGVAQKFAARTTGHKMPAAAGALGQSIWIEPAVTHGAWLELFQR